MNFDKNCKHIVEDYLLGKSALYNSRGALSILATLAILGCTKYLSISKNSYINQLVIPVTTFILCMIIITIVARLLISKKDKVELKNKCKLWINDPNIASHPDFSPKNEVITMNLNKISNYNGRINGWHLLNGKEQVREKFELKDINMPQVNSNFVVQDGMPNVNIDNSVRPQDNLVNGHQIYSATPVGGNFYEEKQPKLENLPTDACLLGNGCGFLCSGTGVNECNVVAPVPGPQWQPQTAKTVQMRLNNGDYVPSNCPQGGVVLRRPQDCGNLVQGSNCGQTQTSCMSAPTINQ
jgi:hypothetical protein